jgi:hypothetical protein
MHRFQENGHVDKNSEAITLQTHLQGTIHMI